MTEKEKAIRQFHFVLTDKDNPALIEHMAGLAKQKQLTEEIKVAIELLAQLKNGNRELLDKLFPNLCEPTPPPPPPTPSNEDLMREIISLKQEMKKRPITQDNSDIPDSRSIGIPAMKPAGKTLGQGVSFSLPKLDDDDELPQMTMKLAPLSNAKNGSNLIAGILGLD